MVSINIHQMLIGKRVSGLYKKIKKSAGILKRAIFAGIFHNKYGTT
jgi:hypothetical protein